ncbi:auxin-responsive protein IAA27-like [Musa acuminata AAA Group]|uniref:auxin-responsive protein IAA27-like n=1 Tax=Musa acuminata AAA Group TaxID=214697 RepID=UPI0031DED8E3
MEDENGHFTPTMFVKVHKQGCAIARKINLKAHDNYESLRRALEEMSRNFLSNPYHPYIQSEEAQNEEVDTGDLVILYENHQGNRMLITDAAWEVFINTARRLYIVKNPEAAVTGKVVVEEELLISSSQVMFGGCFMYYGGESSSS